VKLSKHDKKSFMLPSHSEKKTLRIASGTTVGKLPKDFIEAIP